MQVLLTGGSGDLGQLLVQELISRKDNPLVLDIIAPKNNDAQFIKGSILDRDGLPRIFSGCDCIVHIAAWHGIHEFRGDKTPYDFFDLNIGGTFNVFESAVQAGVKNIVFISTTSVDEPDSLYGNSKILAEQIADFYFRKHRLNIITLRPRAFIPHWNKTVYQSYLDWAKWYWGGAVHIDDVCQAVVKAIDLVCSKEPIDKHHILPIDGAYEYSDEDLNNWDKAGPGTTFNKYYKEYNDLVKAQGLDPSIKPKKLDISNTEQILGYKPQFSLKNLLEELSTHSIDTTNTSSVK